MRTLLVVGVCLALVGCDDDDKPAGRPTAASDALWKLAPEGTTRAIVISPYGADMLDGGVTALRAFFEKGGEEVAPLAAQLDGLLGGFGPFKEFSLQKFHLTPKNGGIAFFLAKEGTVAVLPIVDRDTFLAASKGTRATTPDGYDKLGDQAFCKQLDKHYVCGSSEAHLKTVGKSAIGERMKKLGARGDIELVGTELPLRGETMPRSTFAAAVTLERGTWVVRGLIGNLPDDGQSTKAALGRPRTTIGKSSGFATFDIRTLLEGDDKVVEGVTQKQLAASIAGPATLDVPAGTRVLDVKVPLSDPKPMQAVVAKCNEIQVLAAFGAKLDNGRCVLDSKEVGLALDVWIEENTLRIGKKEVISAEPVPMSKVGMELARGEWSLAFWGRGTIFGKLENDTPRNLDGVDPSVGTQARLLSLLNEFGFGMKRDKDDVRFLLTMRTMLANPQDVVDKLLAITGKDVVGNTASKKAEPIATAHKSSPFNGDFVSGAHGMLLPTQMLNQGLGLVVPAALLFLRGNQPPKPEAPPAPPPPPGARTERVVKAYATLGLEEWKKRNPDKPCPPSMEHFATSIGAAVLKDEWGTDLVLKCGKDLPAGAKDIAVISAGPDKKIGTEDDIKSY